MLAAAGGEGLSGLLPSRSAIWAKSGILRTAGKTGGKKGISPLLLGKHRLSLWLMRFLGLAGMPGWLPACWAT